MSISLSEQMSFSIDVAISLRKEDGLPEAIINRQLVDFLLAIEKTASMKTSCDRMHISLRSAQRMLKKFTDGSGLRLIEHHACLGSVLTNEGKQCIALYVATLDCINQLLKEHALPRALPSLTGYPQGADWNHRNV